MPLRWTVLALLFAGCAAPQVIPPPASRESSGIAIDLGLRVPLGWPTVDPDVVYFVKIDGDAGLQQTNVILPSCHFGGRFYLLNVDPGDYAAVVATYTQQVTSAAPTGSGAIAFTSGGENYYITFFSKVLVERTRVSVGPGQFAFMGRYVVDEHIGINADDPVQRHYMFLPATAEQSHGLGYCGTIHSEERDDAAAKAFFAEAREDLGDSGWRALLP